MLQRLLLCRGKIDIVEASAEEFLRQRPFFI